MVRIAKVVLTVCSVVICSVVLWSFHLIVKPMNIAESSVAFIALWTSFGFGVSLLVGAMFISREGKRSKIGESLANKVAAQQQWSPVLYGHCGVPSCRQVAVKGSLYCSEHRLKCSPVGGQ